MPRARARFLRLGLLGSRLKTHPQNTKLTPDASRKDSFGAPIPYSPRNTVVTSGLSMRNTPQLSAIETGVRSSVRCWHPSKHPSPR